MDDRDESVAADQKERGHTPIKRQMLTGIEQRGAKAEKGKR